MHHLLYCVQAWGMGVFEGLPWPVTPWVIQHGHYTGLLAGVSHLATQGLHS